MIPGLGRSPGEGKGYPLQYSGLDNSMDYTWGHKELDMTEQLSLFNAFEKSRNEKTKERLSTDPLVVLLWEQFCFPRGYLAMSRDLCGCHSWKGGMLVASSR